MWSRKHAVAHVLHGWRGELKGAPLRVGEGPHTHPALGKVMAGVLGVHRVHLLEQQLVAGLHATVLLMLGGGGGSWGRNNK